jgi:hypothetical protein
MLWARAGRGADRRDDAAGEQRYALTRPGQAAPEPDPALAAKPQAQTDFSRAVPQSRLAAAAVALDSRPPRPALAVWTTRLPPLPAGAAVASSPARGGKGPRGALSASSFSCAGVSACAFASASSFPPDPGQRREDWRSARAANRERRECPPTARSPRRRTRRPRPRLPDGFRLPAPPVAERGRAGTSGRAGCT